MIKKEIKETADKACLELKKIAMHKDTPLEIKVKIWLEFLGLYEHEVWEEQRESDKTDPQVVYELAKRAHKILNSLSKEEREKLEDEWDREHAFNSMLLEIK